MKRLLNLKEHVSDPRQEASGPSILARSFAHSMGERERVDICTSSIYIYEPFATRTACVMRVTCDCGEARGEMILLAA
jgi:hypothetical protein